jgi:hypothetical protein
MHYIDGICYDEGVFIRQSQPGSSSTVPVNFTMCIDETCVTHKFP